MSTLRTRIQSGLDRHTDWFPCGLTNSQKSRPPKEKIVPLRKQHYWRQPFKKPNLKPRVRPGPAPFNVSLGSFGLLRLSRVGSPGSGFSYGPGLTLRGFPATRGRWVCLFVPKQLVGVLLDPHLKYGIGGGGGVEFWRSPFVATHFPVGNTR